MSKPHIISVGFTSGEAIKYAAKIEVRTSDDKPAEMEIKADAWEVMVAATAMALCPHFVSADKYDKYIMKLKYRLMCEIYHRYTRLIDALKHSEALRNYYIGTHHGNALQQLCITRGACKEMTTKQLAAAANRQLKDFKALLPPPQSKHRRWCERVIVSLFEISKTID